jgi:hypothetical protein
MRDLSHLGPDLAKKFSASRTSSNCASHIAVRFLRLSKAFWAYLNHHVVSASHQKANFSLSLPANSGPSSLQHYRDLIFADRQNG